MSDRTPPAHPVPSRAVRTRPRGSSFDGASLPPLIADLFGRREVSCVVSLSSPTSGEVHELSSSHPLDRLLGARVGRAVAGLAVIAAGRVIDHADPVSPGSPGSVAPGTTVRIAQVVWRSGAATAAMAIVAPSGEAGRLRPFVGSSGAIPDAMRRALELPTPPSSSGPDAYWFLAWLAAIADVQVTEPVEAAAWHPGIDPRELDFGFDERELATFCIERLVEHSAITGWEGIRRSAAEGWLDIGSCDARLAAWFDEGSFSRHIIQQLVDPVEAYDRLGPCLPDETADLLARALASISRGPTG